MKDLCKTAITWFAGVAYPMRHLILIAILLLGAGAGHAASPTDNGAWLYGKWQLSYDPDGAKTDWLEFLPNGDAWSIGQNGRIAGFYIIDGNTVKAVFTWKGKDFIMNFRADRQRHVLRIVTSRSGKASIYKKINTP